MSWATSEAVSVLTFLLPGFVGAAVFNHNTGLTALLRRIGVTRETAYPSEWHLALAVFPFG